MTCSFHINELRSLPVLLCIPLQVDTKLLEGRRAAYLSAPWTKLKLDKLDQGQATWHAIWGGIFQSYMTSMWSTAALTQIRRGVPMGAHMRSTLSKRLPLTMSSLCSCVLGTNGHLTWDSPKDLENLLLHWTSAMFHHLTKQSKDLACVHWMWWEGRNGCCMLKSGTPAITP